MKDKTTLFEYLYENLKEQIVSGRIKCGESLPLLSTAIIKTAKNQRLSMYWSVNHLLLKFIKPWPC